jgi:glutathione reductase (NADPH)
MPRFDFDLYVIGAGSGGVRASRMAAATGARVAVAEAGPLGGTCVNAGCVPKKLLHYAAQFGSAFEDAGGFGWTKSKTAFDWPTLIAHKDREIARLNEVYRGLLEGAGVAIHHGFARLADRHTVEVDGGRFTAETILIAAGGRPYRPDVEGADLAITSNEAFHLPALPKRVLVIGGGYIAVEFAGIFSGLGSSVSLIHRGPLFLRGFDHDVRRSLADEMSKRGISLLFDTVVDRIERADAGGLVAATSDGNPLEVDLVLCAMGRLPNTDGLGLVEAGVLLTDRGAVAVDRYSQSSVPGIYAVGDVTDRRALTPVAIAEAMAFVETVFRDTPATVDYSNIPSAVFSEPEIGTVGLSEEDARAQGHDVAVYRSVFRPMVHTLSGRDERTMMKLVVDRATDRVLGAHMVGPDAGEIIQGIAVALTCGATKESFDSTIGIHPTAAEEFVTMRTERNES